MDFSSALKAPRFNEKDVYRSMSQALGKRTMDRFGPVRRPVDVKECLMTRPADLEAYILLKVRIEGSQLDSVFRPHQILRVAMYHKFNVDKSLRLLKHMDAKNWNISAEQLDAQLSTHTLFPLPNKLMSKDSKIKSFFYMKPSRFVPSETTTSSIIANLLYVMDSLDYFTDPNASNNKIGFIANMNNWTMSNFSVDYCLHFMEALQGKKGPIQVDMFLIVNPPSWFDKVWQTMKPMLSAKFRTKVHMVSEDNLGKYLASGYEKYLPHELSNGQVDMASHVKDFIKYRKYVEAKIFPEERQPTKETKSLVRTKSVAHQRRSSLKHNDKKVPHSSSAKAVSTTECLRPSRKMGLGRFDSSKYPESADFTTPVSEVSDDSE